MNQTCLPVTVRNALMLFRYATRIQTAKIPSIRFYESLAVKAVRRSATKRSYSRRRVSSLG